MMHIQVSTIGIRAISCFFLDSQKNLGVSSFTILALDVSLKLEMYISLRILNLMGEIKLETLTFTKNTMIVLIHKVI